MAKNKSSATKSTLTEIVNKTVKNRQRRKKLKTVPAVTLPATELLDKKTDLTNEQIAPISEKLKAQNIYRGFTKLAINIKTKRRFQIGFGAILILSLFLYFLDIFNTVFFCFWIIRLTQSIILRIQRLWS